MYLVNAGKPISASELGYSGSDAESLMMTKKTATGAGGTSNLKASEWEGNCPLIRVVIEEKWVHMVRPPGTLNEEDKGGFPPGTNKWPSITDAVVRSIIIAAWLRIDSAGAIEGADAKTRAARAMGKAKWQGTEGGHGMLVGRAATNIRNNATHSSKNWWPTQIKAGLLKELNSRAPVGTAAGGGGGPL